jgi:RNA polymerase sigma-70 factor (ECF subfamily)
VKFQESGLPARKEIGTLMGHAANEDLVDVLAGEPMPSDEELAARAIAGERDAFAAIYQRYHVAIYRFARAMTGSTTLAEDVTQETFVELIRTVARYDAERGPLRTYVYAIARNVSRYRLRRERRFVELDPAVHEPRTSLDPAHPIIQSQTVARVRRFIRALPSRYREVLVLCDLQGLSYEEAAAVIRAPVGTVRSRLHRARQQLAERLAKADTIPASVTQRPRTCLI